MQRKTLRRIIIFGTVVMTGLLIVQGFWMSRAFNIEERQFNHSVQVALKNIADSIVSESPENKNAAIRIRQLSSKFYFAELNSSINPDLLDSLLKKELGIRKILAAYELGIYNADDDTLVYGEYIPATMQWQIDHTDKPDNYDRGEKSNFAVYFPDKFSVLAGELKIWIFSSVILLLMTIFFAYAIIMLLKERQLAEIKEDFINNLTHEFKTPIANIELASEVLKENKIEQSKQSRYYEIIHTENQRLKSQVEHILQMGTADRGELQLNYKPVNIHDLIQKLTESLQMRVQKKTGILDIALNASQPEILADEFHLTNTVYNVLDNAEKYSRDKPEISISTSNGKNGLFISIRDAGIGIRERFQKHIFDKFFRVPTGDVQNVKGFGLGLSYVKAIVEAHKGSISIHSEPNKGTQFDIYLPFE
jgi:two-component system phosphate regulon sensor histidine kinase PhoR